MQLLARTFDLTVPDEAIATSDILDIDGQSSSSDLNTVGQSMLV